MTQDTHTLFSRSGSGAYIARFDDIVVKTGTGKIGERIDRQVEWLRENAGPHVVPVLDAVPGTLVMPHLNLWPPELHVADIFRATVTALEEVWKREPKILDPYFRMLQRFEARVERVFGQDTYSHLTHLEGKIKWEDLPRGRTHGDPTLCNTLQSQKQAILIDPLPADDAVPDIIAVDLGKLLQSCLGWESVAHGWRADTWDWPEAVYALCNDENEWLATRYWCLIHLARLVPYYPQHREQVERMVRRARGL